ncbi:DNA repair protein rhp54 [Hordeum vulgare]|nr:DNA repair protein rhp54 [Hordeum vulgare]
MDDDLDLDVAAGLASLTSSGKGKPCAPRKVATPKPKKVLTPEQRAKESAKRKDRRHAANARDEAIVATAAQQQVTNARVKAATREALCMMGLNSSQHGLINVVVASAVSTGSPAFPRTVLPDSPSASACNLVPGFHIYPQASRLSGECSPMVSMVAPSTLAPAPIDVNATLVAAGSSAGGARKTRAGDNSRPAVGRAQPVRRNVGLDLDGIPLNHEFPEDYGLEEEDEHFKLWRHSRSNTMASSSTSPIALGRLDMQAEKQAQMLEMEAEKQAKMLEIEAVNAKTKAKEVALASMMTGVEIM